MTFDWYVLTIILLAAKYPYARGYYDPRWEWIDAIEAEVGRLRARAADEPRRDDEIRREEALRRLQSAQELFGRGDQQQWHRYERGDGRDVSQTVFAVWDSGARALFSGMENTALFTRPEAEVELARLMRDADVNSYEIGALLHALERSRG